MNMLTNMTRPLRHEGDPRVIETGPSARGISDRVARGLGWFSIGLGVAEIFAAKRITRALGMEGQEALIRGYGVRELGAGIASNSVDSAVGVWSRVGGDMLDLATLAAAYTDDNPKKRNVGIAIAAVVGITLIDIACAGGLTARHGRGKAEPRDYSDRSGWPKGMAHSRGAAKDFEVPRDMRAELPMPGRSDGDGRASPASRQLADAMS